MSTGSRYIFSLLTVCFLQGSVGLEAQCLLKCIVLDPTQVAEAAERAGQSPADFCRDVSQQFKSTFERANVSFDGELLFVSI